MIREDSLRCTGCAACANICPVDAITMQANAEGFLYPKLDKSKCINCNKCNTVCQLETVRNVNDQTSTYYAAVNSSKEQLIKSSSGGFFLALAHYVISVKGVVIGCAFDQDMVARHVAAETVQDCEKMCGSKYVQSDIAQIYREAKKYLDAGRLVLFTGTPCQVEGLNLFLGKAYDNQITVDLICHGVPSPLLWEKHKSWLEERKQKKIREYRFRGKDKAGWSLYYYYYYYYGSKKCYSGISNLDPYYQDFLRCKNYRESCYSCAFAKPERISDFTIGDYWGGERLHLNFNKELGISLVLANSNKAQLLLCDLAKYVDFCKTDYDYALENNKQLTEPVPRPVCRDTYYSNVLENVQKWENDFRNTREWRIVKIKSLIPIGIKKVVKKVLNRA